MSERGPQHQSWYLARDGKQLGPYASDEVLRLAETGELRAGDLIWKPGFDAWKPIHSVSGLIAPPPAPRIPKLLAGLITPPPPPLPQSSRQGSLAPLTDPGSAVEWIERMPLRWARNGAIAGAILGTSYVVSDPDGVYLLVIATALLGACGAVAGFFTRDRLRRLQAFDAARATSAISALPLRYAIWGASLGGIPALLSIGDIPDVLPEIPIGAVGALLIALGATLICGIAGFLVGFVLQRNLRKRLPQAGQAAQAPADARWNNVIARHWRGELSLPVSYWVVGFLGNIAVYAIVLGLSALFVRDETYHPLPIFFFFVAMWTSIIAVTVWQIVGLWRSARRYRTERIEAGRPAFWGGVAHVMATLAVVQLGATIFYAGLPQLNEVARMAFLDDPEMGPYAIRIMRNGTEAEITGGIKYGLTDDFIRVFNASPQISVVHLDSPGGRAGEALKLNKAIKERGLMTYVANECQSACAMVFAAGRVRWIRRGAIIGFHSGHFPGMSDKEDADSESIQRRVYLEAGFDPDLIQRALSTPSDDMLTPSEDELLKAKVVSAVSDGGEFAASGYGGQVSKDTLAERLVKLWPVLGAMKERLPQDYAALVDGWYSGYIKGETDAEIYDAFWAKLHPTIMLYHPRADDDVLIDFAALSAEEYTALGRRDPELCYRYASGKDASGSFYRHLPDALLDREIDIYKRIVETMAVRPSTSKAESDRIFAKLRKSISDERVELAFATDVPPEKYEDYCRAWVDLYQEIVGLRETEAAAAIRTLWGDELGSEATASIGGPEAGRTARETSGAGDEAGKRGASETQPGEAAVLLAAIEARFPQDYGEMTKNFDQATIKGMAAHEIAITLGPELQRFIRDKVPQADDDVLADLGALMAEQLTALATKDANFCFRHVSGHGVGEAYAAMPPPLVKREFALYERVMATATDRPKLTKEDIAPLMGKIRGDIPREDIRLLLADDVPPEKYQDYCRIAAVIYDKISRLERHDAATLVRLLWEALERPPA